MSDTPETPATPSGANGGGIEGEYKPMDELNKKTLAQTRPSNYTNPTPAPKYTMVVLGGGSAGLTVAATVAGMGGKVALIEKGYLGGDCLNVGCVPSKTLLRSSKAIAEMKDAAKYGIRAAIDPEVVFSDVLRRVRSVRETISYHDGIDRMTKLGIDVFFGNPKFTGKDSLEVDGKEIKFVKATIATGGRPLVLPIPGLKEAGFETNESLFTGLETLPKRMAVIGAGPIGCELSQAFARFGTKVTVFDISDRPLAREDPDAAEIVVDALSKDGVEWQLKANITQVDKTDDGAKRLSYTNKDGESAFLDVDLVLMAVGRVPNTPDGCDAAGIKVGPRGHVLTNDKLQTSNSRVYAAGDVTHKYQFTHVAGHAGGIVIQNALFPGFGRKFSSLVIPWATYTTPEVAHVGKYAHECDKDGTKYDVFKQDLSHNDRGLADDDTTGFVKFVVAKGSDKILGCTIVSKHASEMISEVTFAMTNKKGLKSFYSVIHPYPTVSEAVFQAALLKRKAGVTPFVSKILNWWMNRKL